MIGIMAKFFKALFQAQCLEGRRYLKNILFLKHFQSNLLDSKSLIHAVIIG